MDSDSSAQTPSIDGAALTPLVRRALGSQSAEVTDWECESIHKGIGYGTAGSSSVYRVSGKGRDGATSRSRAAIGLGLLAARGARL